MSSKRIAKELNDLKKEALPQGCEAGLVSDDNVYEWAASIGASSLSIPVLSVSARKLTRLPLVLCRGTARLALRRRRLQPPHHAPARVRPPLFQSMGRSACRARATTRRARDTS